MIVLVSGATKYVRTEQIGHLIVPRAWNDPAALDFTVPWAMDNGAFSGFDEGAYVRMIERHQAYQASQTCRFVTAPDVVADAAATTMRWPFWSRLLRSLGWCPAYVAQDGLTAQMMPNLQDGRGALFVGGSTAFKEGSHVRDLCAYAKARGIWVHWGRVNGKRRYELALKAGADSIDGTGFSMYPDTNIPKVEEWQERIRQQPELGL